ncbi:MAG TPA: L-seryl-tRNA(Sec) selenium transferase [Anaerolineales bacterium]|nr:L-seryl-tRNA(Sec) selenium transferase [Anaerolineales bacterium]
MTDLRSLPSVDQLLQTEEVNQWISSYGRPLTLDAIRSVLDKVRLCYAEASTIPDRESLLEQVGSKLQNWTAPTLRDVINATGVILHTNLGRAPLSQAALDAIRSVASGYSTLEYDLRKGKRGTRLVHAETLLKRITGASAALVVNNNAAAVMLALTALARRRAVVIARTQLVEIGGGFRVPDVMKQSGARLVEVGTTNRVHLADYESALDESPVMILRAHRSNFRIIGFTTEPSLAELASLARRVGIPLVDDLGSGSLLDTSRFGLGHEPMVQESLAQGADLVCFSGDKLLGGPQAGIIVGRADLVAKLKKHPLARAIRADKLCLAGLSATLLHYLKDEAAQEVPVWRMIAMPTEQIRERAQNWVEVIGHGEVIDGESTVGGGSLPGETLPTFILALRVRGPNRFLARLRESNPAIIARLDDDRVVLDPRTVLPEQEGALLDGLRRVYEKRH